MYTIYSVGDVQFLARVFDGVSMLTGSGSLVGASAIACLIGVIFLCFQSVINTQGIKIQNVLVCFVIYLVCFAVPTQVNIVSSRDDSDFAQRDNVPLGIAMIGSTISTITHELTKKMELAMDPILTDSRVINASNGGGYANSLYLLNHVTRPQTGYVIDVVEDISPNFKYNLTNYCAECTVIKYLLGGKNYSKDFSLLVTSDAMDAFKFNSNIYYTSLIDPATGEADDYSCAAGGEKIVSWWNDAVKNMDEKQAKRVAKELLGYNRINNNIDSYQNIVDAVQKATNEMYSLGSGAADRGLPQYSTKAIQELLFANATREVVMRGIAQGYTSFADSNTSFMLTQAMLQRNSQWSAESSMFLNSVPAIMAFIEGFFYAITPFASILILLGLFGLNIFIKYIVLLLWVQLWTPVMAIINMYIMHGAASDIFKIPTQLQGQDASVSIYMNDSIAQVTENWISVGSMFMAATPLLTFIILTGSAYALTSLTGRMNGADVINEKMITPDLIQPGAGLAMSAVYNGNMNSTLMAGMENLLQKFSLSSSVSATKSYAETDAIKKQKDFAIAFDQAVQKVGGVDRSLANQTLQNAVNTGSENELKSFVQGMSNTVASQMARDYNLTSEQAEVLSSKISGGVGFNLGGFVKASYDLSKEDSFKSMSSDKLQQLQSSVDQAMTNYQNNHSGAYALAVANTLQESGSFEYKNSELGNALNSVKNSKDLAESATKQASEMGQINEVLQSNGSYNAVDLISSLNNAGPQGRAQLQRLDQLYQEVYDNATGSEKQMLDNCVNSAKSMHLTNDTATDERVGKLMALATADLGEKGIDSGDLSRSVKAMEIATSALPGSHSSTLEQSESANVLNATKGNASLGINESTLAPTQADARAIEQRSQELINTASKYTPQNPGDIGAMNKRQLTQGFNIGNIHIPSPKEITENAQGSVITQNQENSYQTALHDPNNPLYSLTVGSSKNSGNYLDPKIKLNSLDDDEYAVGGTVYSVDSNNHAGMTLFSFAKAGQKVTDKLDESINNNKDVDFDVLNEQKAKIINQNGGVFAGTDDETREKIEHEFDIVLDENARKVDKIAASYVWAINGGYNFGTMPDPSMVEQRVADLEHLVKSGNLNNQSDLGTLTGNILYREYDFQQSVREANLYKEDGTFDPKKPKIRTKLKAASTSYETGSPNELESNKLLDKYQTTLDNVKSKFTKLNSGFAKDVNSIESSLANRYEKLPKDQVKVIAHAIAHNARIMATCDYSPQGIKRYNEAKLSLLSIMENVQKYK